MRIWIDVKNSHEPLFFKSISKMIENSDLFFTTRDYAEIVKLMKSYNFNFTNLGGRVEGHMIKRILGFYFRALYLAVNVPSFDISISHLSGHAILASNIRRRKHIAFTDNDVNSVHHSRIFPFIDKLIVPRAIPVSKLTSYGIDEKDIFRYDGYKEDIYLSDYKPDKNFLSGLPFNEFVTVRPEASQAIYVPKNFNSIVPELLEECMKNNINVLFLPRYETDREYSKKYPNVFIPENPVNGLDACYYSKAVLTGAGTFSREAACLGTPAVSFYPGKKFLSVDKKMILDRWVFHSREPKKIIEYVLNNEKKDLDLKRSREVNTEVREIMSSCIERSGMKD